MKKKIVPSLALLFASLMALPGGAMAADQNMPSPEDLKTKSENTTSTGLIGPVQEESSNYVTASIASYHFHKQKNGEKFNEFNPGLGFEHVNPLFKELGDGGLRTLYAGGFYYNSHERISLYAAAGIEACSSLKDTFTACAGILGGIVTGYPNHPVAPMVEPYVKAEHNETGMFAKVGIIPPHNNNPMPTLALQIGKSF